VISLSQDHHNKLVESGAPGAFALGFIFFSGVDSNAQCDKSKKVSCAETADCTVKEASFKVFGNCEMCADKIETAAKKVEGVKKAEWNTESKLLKVSFDSDKAKLQIGGKTITGIQKSFGESETGELIALYGTAGYIIVAIVNGNAYDLLKPDVGDKVQLIF